MPTFIIQILSRCFAIIQKVHLLGLSCLLFVESGLLGQRLCRSNQFVTSLPLFLLTTPHPSTQISANAVFPSLQKLIHCFAMNELKKKVDIFPIFFISHPWTAEINKELLLQKPSIIELTIETLHFCRHTGQNIPL